MIGTFFRFQGFFRSQPTRAPLVASALGALLAVAAVQGIVAHAQAEDLDAADTERVLLQIDRAQVLRLAAPAKTIVIGNPSIADATVYDQTTIILTGKSFGETNIIVLDSTGKIVHEKALRVATPNDVVVVNRGTAQISYSCSPNCARTLRIGDETEAFAQTLQQTAGVTSLNQGLGQGGN